MFSNVKKIKARNNQNKLYKHYVYTKFTTILYFCRKSIENDICIPSFTLKQLYFFSGHQN